MARTAKPKGRTQVTAYDHEETRRNIPTADAAATFYDEAKDALPPLRYPRNPDLDPQLVWKGKDAQDDEELIVDAPPIYIQEKIVPQALIENLRKRSVVESVETTPSLFDFAEFDELKDLEAVEFYQHDESWKNRMILGDSLQVMGSLAEREALRGKVQMIYIDPPYGIKFGSNWQARASKRDVKDGKLEDAAREAEQIKAFRDTWELGIHSYLSYLRDRLVVARDLLSDSGSVFVQIGDENVHLVRSLLDEVFGPENAISLIGYRTTTGATSDFLAGTMDFIVWYAKDKKVAKFRPLYKERSVSEDANYRSADFDGEGRSLTAVEMVDKTALQASGARLFRQNPITSQSGSETTRFPVHLGDKTFTPGKGGWKTNAAGMEKLRLASRLLYSGKTLGFKRYFDDFGFESYSNAWDDTRQSGFGEAKTYVV
jgi:adenine-specific DNA-methyltransferase